MDQPRKMSRRTFLLGLVGSSVALATACATTQPPPTPTTAPKPTEAPRPAAPTEAVKPVAPTQAPAVAKPTEAPKPAAPTAAAKPTTAAALGRRGGKATWAVTVLTNTLSSGNISQPPTHVLMYSSLLEWDRALRHQPALAESWEATNDRTYVYKLRRGVTFHVGKQLDAEDVKYSHDHHRTPPPPGLSFAFYPKIDTVEIVDRSTIRINLKEPDPALVGFTAWTRYSNIMPKGMYDRVNILTQGIGTGPFKLVEFVPEDRAVLTRHGEYWNSSLPYLEELTLKYLPDEQARVAALRSGTVDVADVSPDVVATLRNDPNLTVLKGLTARYLEMQFTTKGEKKPWHDARVRQAINHAINRQDLAEKVYGGEAGLSSVVPTGYGDWPLPQDELKNTYLTFDLDKARRSMAEAGFANGFPMTIQSIAVPRDYTQAAEVVREHLKQIKIDVTVQPIEIGTFAKNNGEGNFDVQLTGRGFRHDPSGHFNEFSTKSAIYSRWFGDGWKNDELQKLIDEALLTPDVPKRLQNYRQAQRILLTELVHIPLVQPMAYLVVRKRLQNMEVSFTTDTAYTLREAWLAGA